ncbi:hypothetical protein ABKA04_007766 [Annulohypoxylon sp. FPYF3050]
MLANIRYRGIVSFFSSFLLCYALAALYLRSKCYRDPSSIFFRPKSARILTYSSFRKAQAQKYSNLAALHATPKWTNSTDTELCVGVASVSRHGFSYLKETLGSILEGLDDLERRNIYLVVFLAHTNQSEHEDFRQPWLVNMADSLPTYPNGSNTISLVRQLEIEGNYEAHARKQKIDYSVLLNECAKVNPKYTMTLEDDVIALDGWYHRALSALEIASRKTRELGRDSFLYLRIFYDGRLLGWNSEEWPLYVKWSVAVVIIEVSILLALRRHIVASRRALTAPVIFLVCGGLVFPQRQVLDHLLPLYRDTQDNHAAVDTFLEDWANNNDGLRWAVTPVLIQHVGGKSSHGAGDQEAGSLTDDMPFDYSFETNDPIKLAKEHRARIVKIREQATTIAR